MMTDGFSELIRTATELAKKAPGLFENHKSVLEFLIGHENRQKVDEMFPGANASDQVTIKNYMVLKRFKRYLSRKAGTLTEALNMPAGYDGERWKRLLQEAVSNTYVRTATEKDVIYTMYAMDSIDRNGAMTTWSIQGCDITSFSDFVRIECLALMEEWYNTHVAALDKAKAELALAAANLAQKEAIEGVAIANKNVAVKKAAVQALVVDEKGASSSMNFAKLVLYNTVITVANVVVTGVEEAPFYVMGGASLFLILRHLVKGNFGTLPRCIPISAYLEFIKNAVITWSAYTWFSEKINGVVGLGSDVVAAVGEFVDNVVFFRDLKTFDAHNKENEVVGNLYTEVRPWVIVQTEYLNTTITPIKDKLMGGIFNVEWLQIFLNGSGPAVIGGGVSTMVGGLVVAFCNPDKLRGLGFKDIVVITNLFTVLGLAATYVLADVAGKERVFNSVMYLVSAGFMAADMSRLRGIFKKRV